MTNEDQWLARVNAWRASGLSAVEFCANQPFEPASLRSWSSRLGRDGKVSRATAGRRPRGEGARASVGFGRIVARADAANVEVAAEKIPSVVVLVGDSRIEVGHGFDPALLRSVVEALSGSAR